MSDHYERRVLVDDTDPRVVYSNSKNWIFDNSGLSDNIGNFGKAFNSTLHGSSNNESFEFAFSGTSIDVYGFNDINRTATGADPRWDCFIDNAQIPSPKPFQYPENNWRLCGAETLPDGNHTLIVNVQSTRQIFWLDYILYTPSQDPDSAIPVIYISERDKDLQYDANWEDLGEFWKMTKRHGASVSVNFTGSRLSWYGMYPKELPHRSALATYSIDSGTEIPFSLDGAIGDVTAYHQLMFKTPNLTQGPHSLIVRFEGDEHTTPLTVDYLIIENGVAHNTTATNSNIAVRANRLPPGSIACIVLFPLLLIAVLILAFFKLRRRKRIQPGPASRAFTLASPPPTPVSDPSRRSWIPHIRTSFMNPTYWRRSVHSQGTRLRGEDGEQPPSRWKRSIPFDSSSQIQELHYRDGTHTPTFALWGDSPTRPDFASATRGSPGVGEPARLADSQSIISADRKSEGDGDQSYYGGYQTKRAIMEQEASARRSMAKEPW